MRTLSAFAVLVGLSLPLHAQTVAIAPSDKGVRIEVDGKLLTEYMTKGTQRPCFYPVMGANDAEMVLRSLPSIAMRYRAQDQSTRALAAWCQTQMAFVQVLHPALAGSPGHAHWQRLCALQGAGSAACLFSVVIDPAYTQDQVDAFCDSLQLFRLGYSWAGPVSLVVPYNLGRMRGAWPASIARGTLVRFAVGFEATEDLQADIAQALAALA
jgi:cystathionine beta-lyase